MPINFNAGVTGVSTARRVMEVIGNNIANVNTEGYSRQEAHLSTLSPVAVHSPLIGQGVTMDSVRSIRDKLVEDRLRLGGSSLAGLETSRALMSQVEEQFNDPTEGGINALLVRLYNNFEAVSTRPQDTSVRIQLLNDAKRLASRIQDLDAGLVDLSERVPEEVDGRLVKVNELLKRIADTNREIMRIEARGQPANSFIDESNRLLTQLSELVKVDIMEDEHHVRTVTLNGEILVTRDKASTLRRSDTNPEQILVLCDDRKHAVTPMGGEIGSLLRFRNESIPEIREELDKFARGLIRVVNGIHGEGLGLDGRFTSLTSENPVADTNQDGDLTNDLLFGNEGLLISPKSGFLHVTVVNDSVVPPTFSRHKIPVEPTKDTLASIATKLSGIDGLSASADPETGTLQISAQAGFSFDFAKPTELGNLFASDPSSPKLSLTGDFTGTGTDQYTFAITDATPADGEAQAQIGSGTITGEVRDQNGTVLRTFNLGSGYIPGQAVPIGNGLSVRFGAGEVVAGNSISTPIYSSDTDTADILPALGLNNFFSGQGAGDIRVSDRVMVNPRNIASALSSSPGDAENAIRISNLFDAIPGISEFAAGTTIAGTFQNLVQNIGQRSQSLEFKEDTQRKSVENLQALRDSISGVSIDEEVAKLLRFQQAFQAAARHITAVNQMTQLLYNL